MAKFKVKCFVKQSDKHDPVRKLATIMEAADHTDRPYGGGWKPRKTAAENCAAGYRRMDYGTDTGNSSCGTEVLGYGRV